MKFLSAEACTKRTLVELWFNDVCVQRQGQPAAAVKILAAFFRVAELAKPAAAAFPGRRAAPVTQAPRTRHRDHYERHRERLRQALVDAIRRERAQARVLEGRDGALEGIDAVLVLGEGCHVVEGLVVLWGLWLFWKGLRARPTFDDNTSRRRCDATPPRHALKFGCLNGSRSALVLRGC